MNRLQTITQHAFKLPSMASENERHIGYAIRRHELADGHRKALPMSPSRVKVEGELVLQQAERALLAFMSTCEDGTTTQRTATKELAGSYTPASVQSALRILWNKRLIEKHVSSIRNRNWYQVTPKGYKLCKVGAQ